jgi:5'-phosphate synthase pdxT subunit
MGILQDHSNLFQSIRDKLNTGLCVWGTCAGLILLADDVHGRVHGQPIIGGLHVQVQRNYFGSQQHSFVTDLPIQLSSSSDDVHNVKAVFIRAPVITRVLDTDKVKVLARLGEAHQHAIVAVQQGDRILGTAFHPELTPDDCLHRHFLRMVEHAVASRSQK